MKDLFAAFVLFIAAENYSGPTDVEMTVSWTTVILNGFLCLYCCDFMCCYRVSVNKYELTEIWNRNYALRRCRPMYLPDELS